jgi:AraC-like DNA-binding protein
MASGTTGEISHLLLGVCAGCLLALAAAMLKAPRPAARWTGFAFFLTSFCFALKLWADGTLAMPPALYVANNLLAWTSCGWFWMMTMAVFEDRDTFEPWMFGLPAAQLLLGLGFRLSPEGLHPFFWTASTLLQAALAILALTIVLRSAKGDLVEQRRRVRGPFMAAVALYILSLNGFDIWEMLGDVPAWYPMFNAALLTALVLSGAFAFLDSRVALFGDLPEPVAPKLPAIASAQAAARPAANGHANGAAQAEPLSASAALDRAAKADLDRLQALMARDEVWKEEGLTIASLAIRASMPEAQLRRLISDCLGYRNFPSFVNSHRIAAAKARLADPDEARVTVSTIAYDIGFASLGPFNRAFKEVTGVSPSEWRRSSLGLSSPIPEEV